MKKKLGITKGECKIDHSKTGLLSNIYVGSKYVAEVKSYGINANPTKQERIKNSELIADAFNTANKCGLLPSDLLKQRDDLLSCLKNSLNISTLWTMGGKVATEHKDEAIALDNMKLSFEQIIKQIEN